MTVSTTDVRIAQRGKGALRAFNEAGALVAADVHVALRLAALGGEDDPDVHLATALAVRAVRSGSVCLDLTRLRDVTVAEDDEGNPVVDPADLPWPRDEDVLDALRRSPLVVGGDRGPLRPLRLVDTTDGPLLYLDRYFRQEQTIRHVLAERSGTLPGLDEQRLAAVLDELFHHPDDPSRPSPAPDRQRVAAALAATHPTTVIAGGPGTGKTHTVARILALLTRLHGSDLRIGLAAPTGKAAARLQESVREQETALGLPPHLTAMTVHRMLGWRPGGRYRYHATNHLPYDVIIVDETSMVSLTIMCRLLEAVRPDTRLIFVGDPDQLASVDAGAVLADLVARPVTGTLDPVFERVAARDLAAVNDSREAFGPEGSDDRERLRNGVVSLSRGRRFDGAIADLAAAVRKGDADRVLKILRSGDPMVSFHDPGELDTLREDVVRSAEAVMEAAETGDIDTTLVRSEDHRLLCAHRDGPAGVQFWARRATEWIGEATGRRLDPDRWYPGQPLLVTANDHDLQIYNGDTGVVVRQGDELVAAFARGRTPYVLRPSQLPAVSTVYAMTIHRSQGSQYGTVSVVLPDARSALLTRELLYTAITRARTHVRIVGTEDAVRAGVARQVLRASGLRREIRV